MAWHGMGMAAAAVGTAIDLSATTLSFVDLFLLCDHRVSFIDKDQLQCCRDRFVLSLLTLTHRRVTSSGLLSEDSSSAARAAFEDTRLCYVGLLVSLPYSS